MKRHKSLAPLSRDHHSALLLAQLLKKNAPQYKGMPADSVGKAAFALTSYLKGLKEHFIKEEILLNKVKGLHSDIDRIANEIVIEHKELSAAFLTIQFAEDLPGELDVLGVKLEQHIRKEERILFPLMEQHCTDKMLEEFTAPTI